MPVLAQVDSGKLTLDQPVRVEKSDFVRIGQRSPIRDKNPKGVELSLRELLRYAVSESDGTASDVLLKLIGADAVTKYLNQLSINELVVINSEKEIGQDWETQYRNWSSPAASVQLLRSLHDRRGLSETSQQLLYKFMIETPTFPTRLKGLLPKTAVVAHKTGSSGTSNGITAATNDIGIVTLPNGHHLAIAVFVSDSAVDLPAREKVIAQIAKAIWDSVTRSWQ
jgi:beta-lactamase class A